MRSYSIRAKSWHAPCLFSLSLEYEKIRNVSIGLDYTRQYATGEGKAPMVLKQMTWPAELTLNLIGGKWKGLILHHLLSGESRRFGEIKRLLPGISAKMLTKHLKELESDGLITRLETRGLHPRILYTPTSRCQTLSPILTAMKQWGEQHLEIYGSQPVDSQPLENKESELVSYR